MYRQPVTLSQYWGDVLAPVCASDGKQRQTCQTIYLYKNLCSVLPAHFLLLKAEQAVHGTQPNSAFNRPVQLYSGVSSGDRQSHSHAYTGPTHGQGVVGAGRVKSPREMDYQQAGSRLTDGGHINYDWYRNVSHSSSRPSAVDHGGQRSASHRLRNNNHPPPVSFNTALLYGKPL